MQYTILINISQVKFHCYLDISKSCYVEFLISCTQICLDIQKEENLFSVFKQKEKED